MAGTGGTTMLSKGRGEMTRVLVADDALIVRRVIAGMVEEAGHAVVGEAGTGEDAVRLYEELRPDVTVLDVNMPGLDGISAAEAIRDAHPDAGLVLASVFVSDERLDRVKALGAVEYVMKPFAGNALVDAVERATVRSS